MFDKAEKSPDLEAHLLGLIPTIWDHTLEWFLSNLIPERFRGEKMGPSVLIDVTGSLSKTETTGGCWSAFPTEPSKSQLPETTAFAPLKSVVNAILPSPNRPLRHSQNGGT